MLTLDPTNGLAYQNLASMVLRQALAAKQPATRGDRLQRGRDATRARRSTSIPSLPDALHDARRRRCPPRGARRRRSTSWKRAVELDAAQFNALYNLWFELADAGRRDEAVRYGRQFVATAPPAFFAPDIARIRAYLRPGH